MNTKSKLIYAGLLLAIVLMAGCERVIREAHAPVNRDVSTNVSTNVSTDVSTGSSDVSCVG